MESYYSLIVCNAFKTQTDTLEEKGMMSMIVISCFTCLLEQQLTLSKVILVHLNADIRSQQLRFPGAVF